MKYLKNRYIQLTICLLVGIAAGNLLKNSSITKIKSYYETRVEEIQTKSREDLVKKQEEIDKIEESSKEYKEETTRNLTSLRTENHTLKQKVKKRKFRLVKPDGTIIEREFEESETDQSSTIVTSIKEEFTRKVSSIEKKWKKIHIKRLIEVKKKYEELLSKKKTEIKIVEKEVIVNPKSFRPEIGVTTNKEVYLHTTYPLWGPIIIGGGGSLNKEYDGSLRMGLGLEF